VVVDVDLIRPGDEWRAVLDRELTRSAALLAIIGPAWEHLTNHDSQPRIRDADDVVRYEIATALDKRLLVIPVLWGAPRRLHPKPCRPSCSDCRACMRRWSISACVRETWSRSPSDSGRRAPLTSTNSDPVAAGDEGQRDPRGHPGTPTTPGPCESKEDEMRGSRSLGVRCAGGGDGKPRTCAC